MTHRGHKPEAAVVILAASLRSQNWTKCAAFFPHQAAAESVGCELLDRTGHFRKDIVRLPADKFDGCNHNNQNHGQHHCIFGNVLTAVVSPNLDALLQLFCHRDSPFGNSPEVWVRARFAGSGSPEILHKQGCNVKRRDTYLPSSVGERSKVLPSKSQRFSSLPVLDLKHGASIRESTRLREKVALVKATQ